MTVEDVMLMFNVSLDWVKDMMGDPSLTLTSDLSENQLSFLADAIRTERLAARVAKAPTPPHGTPRPTTEEVIEANPSKKQPGNLLGLSMETLLGKKVARKVDEARRDVVEGEVVDSDKPKSGGISMETLLGKKVARKVDQARKSEK